MRSLAPTHKKQIEAMNKNVQTKSQAVQTTVPVTEAVQKEAKETIKVECLNNSKVLYWTTGLAAGSAIGLTAFVVWKMVRDWKRK